MSSETQIEPGNAVEIPEGYMPGKNGGLLKRGGNEGWKSPGRPANKVRAKMSMLADGNLEAIAKLAKAGQLTPGAMLRWQDILLKYSMGEAKLAADEFAVLAGECIAETLSEFNIPDSDLIVKRVAELLGERLKLGG